MGLSERCPVTTSPFLAEKRFKMKAPQKDARIGLGFLYTRLKLFLPALTLIAFALGIGSTKGDVVKAPTTSVSPTERSIHAEIMIEADIEKVWRAWTTEAGIKTFFAPDARVDLRVG